MFKLKLNNKKIPQYQCPLSSISMNKPCPVNSCHAWLQGKHCSNCLFQIYPNKTEFDRYDLMYVLGCNEKKLREKQTKGKFQVYNAATIFSILSLLRENDGVHCEHCGVLRTTKGPCINREECKGREALACYLLKSTVLRFPEFKATKNDVYLLLHNKNKIQQYINATEQAQQWYEVFDIKQDIQEKTNLVRTIV